MKIKGWTFYVLISVFVVVVGVADYFHLFIFSENSTSAPSGSVVRFRAVVVSEPEEREFNTRLYIKVLEIEEGGGGGSVGDTKVSLVGEKILVTTARYSETPISYGDVLDVSGIIETPENFLGSSGREFDYIGYLQAKNINFRMSNPRIVFIRNEPSSKILQTLFAIKRGFISRIDAALSEPQSSLAAGILIDGKGSIDATLQDEFKKAGIVHIVVLSGFNVTIVADTIFKIFSLFLPRLASIGSASLGILAFAFITGGTTTVIRASIMAALALLAKAAFRNYDPARALFLTGVVMIAFNPRILLHDPSFQLSFMATFSVIVLVPIFEDLFHRVPERFGLRGLISATVITQFFLLPLLMYMTGTISLVALPVNFIVLPTIPVAMLLSFITACLAFISPFVALPAAFIAHIVLSYIIGVAHWSASLRFAEIAVGNISIIFVALSYIGIGWWAWRRWKVKKLMKKHE